MTNIVLLTRDSAIAPDRPIWVLAMQEDNVKEGSWRFTVWGKDAMDCNGVSAVEVETSLDEYIVQRKETGYVTKARLTIDFSMAEIMTFIQKNILKVMPYIQSFMP